MPVQGSNPKGGAMLSTAETIEGTRPLLEYYVEQEHRRLGSKKAAYAAVGSTIGRSSEWVRKIIGRAPGLGLSHATALAIQKKYDAICARLEAAAEHDLARARALRRKHAVAASTSSASEGVPRTDFRTDLGAVDADIARKGEQ